MSKLSNTLILGSVSILSAVTGFALAGAYLKASEELGRPPTSETLFKSSVARYFNTCLADRAADYDKFISSGRVITNIAHRVYAPEQFFTGAKDEIHMSTFEELSGQKEISLETVFNVETGRKITTATGPLSKNAVLSHKRALRIAQFCLESGPAPMS